MTVSNIWFSNEDARQLRQSVAEGHPHAAGLWRVVEPLAARTAQQLKDDGFAQGHNREPLPTVAQCAAIGYLITGDRAYATRAADAYDTLTRAWTGAQLSIGHWGMLGSIVAACCYDALDEKRQAALIRKLVWCAQAQQEVPLHSGNPHVVSNNHWAVSHSGAVMAAMAAHGKPTQPGSAPCDMTELIHWSRARLKAFATQLGNAGLYHEGLGYTLYTFDLLLPAIIACKNFDGYDIASQIPGIEHIAASFFATAADRPGIKDDGALADPTRSWGMMLSWNDAGQSWPQDNATINMIHLASREPAGLRGGLRWMWDRLSGHEGPGIYAPGFGGYFFALVHYPYDAEPTPPDAALPHRVTDHRQGLHFARNRYADGDDAILGVYAKTTFAGGHKQDDAGSLRFMALGYDWCMGGGQARGDRAYQTVCYPADESGDSKGLGPIMLDEADAALGAGCGVFGVDMRRVSNAYHERLVAVDYSGASGCPAVLALLDQIDDHRAGRDWLWTQTFDPRLTATIDPDGRGFTLASPDHITMRVCFLASVPAQITLERMPDSKRTYQGGTTVHYPGRPYIRARFTGKQRHGIYALMTVSRDAQPQITRLSEGVGVQLGGYAWSRPFGPAVPDGYAPGLSGSLCKYPTGRDDYRAPFS